MMLLVLVLFAALAGAQSRYARTIRSNLVVGWGPSMKHNYALNKYYTGMGTLTVGYKPADGSGVLGSSIYRQQSMTVSRPDRGAPTPQKFAVRPATPQARRLYQAPSYRIPTVRVPARARAGAIGAYLSTSTASASAYYAAAAPAVAKAPRQIPKQVLTSLVPAEPAKHRRQMIEGERAFSEGKYARALAHFETARKLSDDSPESLLSLGRTSFALADGSYSKTAEHLCKVLQIVPELPMVRVFPRSFYGKQQDYLQHVSKLEAHVKAHPDDFEAQFVLGYLRWRQGKEDQARQVLNTLVAAADVPHLTKGAEILLASIAGAEQVRLDELPEMAEPVEYPCAGIRLSLPKGFKLAPLDRARQILKAATSSKEEAMTIVLAGQPVGEGVTPGGIWDYAMGFWRTDPAVSELALIEERDVSIANLPAVGRLFTYSSRGIKAASLGLCFIREVERTDAAGDAAPIRIGYALLVTSARKQMHSMIGVINAVARSTELTKISRPIDTPMELTDTIVRDLHGKYTLRVPAGWSSGHDEMGVVMGRMDYLLGGVASPGVRVVTLDVPESMSAKACGQSAIQHAAEQQGNKIKILSQGPAKMGQIEGYQFVVQKQVPLAPAEAGAAQFSQPFIEVGRMVSAPAGDGRRSFYVVIVTCYDSDATQAQAVMDTLSDGFMPLRSSRQ